MNCFFNKHLGKQENKLYFRFIISVIFEQNALYFKLKLLVIVIEISIFYKPNLKRYIFDTQN